jgi:sugar/nucleoside kinase (ribokinase family)
MPTDTAESNVPQVVVAGHICLDIIPTFLSPIAAGSPIITPGALTNIGAARLSTGGVVSNTGLALHRLGVPTRLMGKVGDDLFGREIVRLLAERDPALAAGMIVVPGEITSYSIVINPPGVDRSFLHCPGANDTFCDADIREDLLDGASIFHFGYPPIMRRMYGDGGVCLEKLLNTAKRRGLVTSLDMARPDPASAAGKVDWPALLRRIGHSLDIFLPSVDELLFMLEGNAYAPMDGATLRRLSSAILEMGIPIIAIKLGDQGLYLRTSPRGEAIERVCSRLGLNVGEWANKELIVPCFTANVVGTTGAGDCTIAGFLAALLRKENPLDAMTAATAVGACSVEVADATCGVPAWEKVVQRIKAGWAKRATSVKLATS